MALQKKEENIKKTRLHYVQKTTFWAGYWNVTETNSVGLKFDVELSNYIWT